MKMEANISSYDDIWQQQTNDVKKTAYEYYLTTNFIYKLHFEMQASQCGNLRLLQKQHKRVLMGQSDVAGWGIFLQGSLACLKDRGHMVILDQASGAPDPISALATPQAHLDLESRTTTGSIVLIPDGFES
nr:SET domain-containing protein [Tanacetum cinerariifolium]